MLSNRGFALLLIQLTLLSDRMPDSQSSEPGLEYPFATVSKIGHFRSLH